MDKHIADFQRGFELASLDIKQPVARPEENGDMRPLRNARPEPAPALDVA